MRFEKKGALGGSSVTKERERGGQREETRERERDWGVERKRKGYNYGMTWHGMD